MSKHDFQLGDEIWFMHSFSTGFKPVKAKVISIIKKIESTISEEIEIYKLTAHTGERSYDLEERHFCFFAHTKEELKEELLKRFDDA